MGSYDTVAVDGHVEQTKALGKGLRTFRLGDAASVYPAPMTFDELEAYDAGTIAPWPSATFQVETETGWAVVQRHILVGWSEDPVEGIQMFDYLGRPLPSDVAEQFQDP